MQRFHHKLYRKFPRYRRLVAFLKRIEVPGFGGVPIFYVLSFFIRGLLNENITTRASAIAYNFFLALFPALIFLFTLIPYMPIDELHGEIIELFEQFLPENAFLTIVGVLEDILETRRGGLLSIGFIFTLFFATNGLYSLMEAFNQHDPRSFWKKRLIALGLTVAFSFLLIVMLSLLIGGRIFINTYFGLDDSFLRIFFEVLRWLISLLIILSGIMMLYYYASYPRRPFRLFLPGGLLAAVLAIMASLLFTFYVENYAQYNYFYGSIGTIIILMLWFYFISTILIIGYELNHSILLARDSLMQDNYLDPFQRKPANQFKNPTL